MREPTRRRVLGTAAAGFAGLLAGCGLGDGTETPTPTATPTATQTQTPTATPSPVESPAFWDWLPTPAALDVERYRTGFLELEPMRTAGAARRLLAPRRYVLEALRPTLSDTSALLTVSNDDFGAGVLRGDYEPATVRTDLADAGFEAAEGENRFVADDRAVDLGADRLVWADHQAAATAIDALLARMAGDGSEAYPARAERLGTVLGAVEPADTRFAIRYLPPERTGSLEGARFHANGMAFEGEQATWRLAVAYADAPPEGALADYREAFAETDGFEVVRSGVDDGLLTLEVDTSTVQATATEPF
jgi:hypothetical protein